METQHRRVALIRRVQFPPGAGTANHRRLRIVDPHHGRYAAQALQRAVVAPQPAQLVLALRPHHHGAPRVRQGHVEGVQRLHGVAYADAGEYSPVDLRLRPGRRLDPAPGAPSRCGIGLAYVALYRAQAATVVVLSDEPGMQLGEIERRILVSRHPVLNGTRHRARRPHLARSPVLCAFGDAPQVIAHRAFVQSQLPADSAIGDALRRQCLDCHPNLQIAHP